SPCIGAINGALPRSLPWVPAHQPPQVFLTACNFTKKPWARTATRPAPTPNTAHVSLHAIGFLEGADLALGLVAGDAVAGLQLADELVAAALDLQQIVVGQLAPLLLHRALGLRPAALHLLPERRRRRGGGRRSRGAGLREAGRGHRGRQAQGD